MPKTCQARPPADLFLLLAAFACLGADGCSSQTTIPKTYAVKGRVVYKDGQPVKNAYIEFRQSGGSTLRAGGNVDDNGEFTLNTSQEDRKAPGAPEGTYQVVVTPKYSGDQTQQAAPIPMTAPKEYKVEANDNNVLVITVEKPRGR